MRRRLTAAGLRNVTVDTGHEERIEVRSGQQLWDWCVNGNPIPGMLVAELADGQKSAMRARMDEALRARANSQGLVFLTAPINIGIGTK